MFIKYYVFSEDFRIFRTLAFLCFFPRCQCVYRQVENQRCSRTGRVQKNHKILRKKHNIWLTPCICGVQVRQVSWNLPIVQWFTTNCAYRVSHIPCPISLFKQYRARIMGHQVLVRNLVINIFYSVSALMLVHFSPKTLTLIM